MYCGIGLLGIIAMRISEISTGQGHLFGSRVHQSDEIINVGTDLKGILGDI